MKQQTNLAGLKIKPTYEELVNYIENDSEKLRYPDRRATFIRNSFYLTQLDGEGMRQRTRQDLMRQRLIQEDQLLRQIAIQNKLSLMELKKNMTTSGLVPVTIEEANRLGVPEEQRTPMRQFVMSIGRSSRDNYESPVGGIEESYGALDEPQRFDVGETVRRIVFVPANYTGPATSLSGLALRQRPEVYANNPSIVHGSSRDVDDDFNLSYDPQMTPSPPRQPQPIRPTTPGEQLLTARMAQDFTSALFDTFTRIPPPLDELTGPLSEAALLDLAYAPGIDTSRLSGNAQQRAQQRMQPAIAEARAGIVAHDPLMTPERRTTGGAQSPSQASSPPTGVVATPIEVQLEEEMKKEGYKLPTPGNEKKDEPNDQEEQQEQYKDFPIFRRNAEGALIYKDKGIDKIIYREELNAALLKLAQRIGKSGASTTLKTLFEEHEEIYKEIPPLLKGLIDSYPQLDPKKNPKLTIKGVENMIFPKERPQTGRSRSVAASSSGITLYAPMNAASIPGPRSRRGRPSSVVRVGASQAQQQSDAQWLFSQGATTQGPMGGASSSSGSQGPMRR